MLARVHTMGLTKKDIRYGLHESLANDDTLGLARIIPLGQIAFQDRWASFLLLENKGIILSVSFEQYDGTVCAHTANHSIGFVRWAIWLARYYA
jgi:hypothetical protein